MTPRIHYETVLVAVEAFATQALRLQILDPSDRDHGGFRCPEHWVCEPLAAANMFASLTTLHQTPDSQYYRSSELLERMHLAMKFIIRSQHKDGTINAYFYGAMRAAPTVALASHALLRAHRWLSRKNQHEELLRPIRAFLRKGMEAIKHKAMFTLHDCWVAAAVLTEFDKQFNDRAAVAKAGSYLQDSIAINNDGIYSDRSTAYSMLSNAMLLILAEKFGRPSLLEYVRRSLNFFLHAFHANGEVATEFSHREDLENGMPTGYSVWKQMSIIDHNGYYASAGDATLTAYLRRLDHGFIRPNLNHPNRHFKKQGESRFLMTSDLGELLAIESERNNDWITRLPIPHQYEEVYPESNIARIRADKVSATIIGDKPILFALQNGGVIIDGFRIRYVYHGFRDYIPIGLEVDAGMYISHNEIIQYVYKPTPNRREVIPLNLQIFVEIEPIADGFQLRVTTKGEKRIPLQLEFGLRKEGNLYIGDVEYDLSETDIIFLDKEPARIVIGTDEIEIDGGVTEHKIYSFDDDWTVNLETARLLITPTTPYDGVIRVTCREREA